VNLLVVSHKECWREPASPTGWASNGGFSFQMQAIAALFDQTRLLITSPGGRAPEGLNPLRGPGLSVEVLPTPRGGVFHKLRLIPWAVRHLPAVWRAVAQTDAVHAAVPGDVGSIGLVVALLQGKRLFVRHCGTWGEPVTISDRLLLWLLERIAGGRRVVLATGGNAAAPSRRNAHIAWIFSTTLRAAELADLPPAQPWTPGATVRLVYAGRLAPEKNVAAIIGALPLLAGAFPAVHLEVAGSGAALPDLQAQARALGVAGQVTFHGNLSHAEVLEVLARGHLFVFPTQVKEGFPKAVLEALACGLPVIATRISVIPHLLRHGAGLLLDETSAPAVAQAVRGMLAAPEKLAEMSRLARAAAQGYTLEAWGEEIGSHLSRAWGALKEGA
jgi:glycosyltransferase involved in cell wall biosynthesis